MDPSLEIAYKAGNAQQAAILKNILSDSGIDAFVTNIALTGVAGEVPAGWSSAPCVMVRQDDLAAARAIAEQFDEDISSKKSPTTTNEEVEEDEDVEGEGHEREPTWPPCPQCSTVRRGRCPNCDAFDAYFSPAEYMLVDRKEHVSQEGASESFEVDSPADLFMCTVCDEAVEPEPLRFCDRCKYDFGDGLEITVPDRPPLNTPVVLTFAVLGAMAIGGLIYVFVITR